MKRILFKTYIGTALLTLFLVGCSDILEEQQEASLLLDFSKLKRE